MNRHIKNKISTPGYFIKRLKDNNFNTFKIFKNYADSDPRRWTILIDPGRASVYVTCYENSDFQNDVMFEFNDGGRLFPKNFSLKTTSIEVVVTKLLEAGVKQFHS
jgi:hypothetical protein